MAVKVTFRRGAESAARLIGLPMTAVHDGVVVPEPVGWSERELASYVIQRAGPYVAGIETVTPPRRLGGCNCMGRR